MLTRFSIPFFSVLAASAAVAGFGISATAALAQTAVQSTAPQTMNAPSPPAVDVDQPFMADPSLMPQLAQSPVVFDSYSLQPPLNYTLSTDRSEYSTSYTWSAQKKADASLSKASVKMIIFELRVPAGSSEASYTSAQMLKEYTDDVVFPNFKKSFRVSATDTGTLNGVVFVHETWSGIHKKDPIAYGLLYGGWRDSSHFAIAEALDSTPDNGGSLALLNASIETLKFKS